MSVNVPVNEAQKEKDINRKLQLYGIYQGKAWLSLAPADEDMIYITLLTTNVCSFPSWKGSICKYFLSPPPNLLAQLLISGVTE